MIYALPDEQFSHHVSLAEGATVAQALARVAGLAPFAQVKLDQAQVGIFGEICDPTRVLRPGDRLEIYRPLATDAKAARRQRAAQLAEQKQPK